MQDTFDLIILGGGPGGYLAGERAGHAGLKTLVIEKRALGGVCLNEGCVPSKALLHSAKIYDYAKGGGEKYGVTATGAQLDQQKVIARKNKVVKTLVSGVAAQLKKNHVTVEIGFGEILGKTAAGFEVAVNGKTCTGKKLLIATGSEPVLPPIPGLREAYASGFGLTNREVLELESIPENFVIIGGGVIGLEMASYFNSAGSRVTVIEMLDHIAGNTDREIASILQKNYEKKGVKFLLSCKVTGIGTGAVEYEQAGEKRSIRADKVLFSIGRRPVTAGFGLEKLAPEMDRGAVKTDEYGRTNIAGLYAAGDVNGVLMLAHTAYRESEVIVNNIIRPVTGTGKKDIMRYHAIPSVIYTNPEVACVGETQESAAKKGYDARTVTASMMYSGRYVAENEGGDGICKLVIDKKNDRLIGVHMIGNYASEIIYGAALMIESEMRTDDIKELVFPHPTVSEIVREALFM
ncbi:MAG: dihydrolipoyl dehydrogenase [Oscillospiraceae bacterium]|nr:dihydrolipoyl dehydrogenase [Oscillospiraceae bacterium]